MQAAEEGHESIMAQERQRYEKLYQKLQQVSKQAEEQSMAAHEVQSQLVQVHSPCNAYLMMCDVAVIAICSAVGRDT